jgi:hypothetical protein
MRTWTSSLHMADRSKRSSSCAPRPCSFRGPALGRQCRLCSTVVPMHKAHNRKARTVEMNVDVIKRRRQRGPARGGHARVGPKVVPHALREVHRDACLAGLQDGRNLRSRCTRDTRSTGNAHAKPYHETAANEKLRVQCVGGCVRGKLKEQRAGDRAAARVGPTPGADRSVTMSTYAAPSHVELRVVDRQQGVAGRQNLA